MFSKHSLPFADYRFYRFAFTEKGEHIRHAVIVSDVL